MSSLGNSNLSCAGQVELGDAAFAVMATGLDDHIDGAGDVVVHVLVGHRHVGLQGRNSQSLDRQLRRFSVQRGE